MSYITWYAYIGLRFSGRLLFSWFSDIFCISAAAAPSISPTQPELPSCDVFDGGCRLIVSTVLVRGLFFRLGQGYSVTFRKGPRAWKIWIMADR